MCRQLAHNYSRNAYSHARDRGTHIFILIVSFERETAPPLLAFRDSVLVFEEEPDPLAGLQIVDQEAELAAPAIRLQLRLWLVHERPFADDLDSPGTVRTQVYDVHTRDTVAGSIHLVLAQHPLAAKDVSLSEATQRPEDESSGESEITDMGCRRPSSY